MQHAICHQSDMAEFLSFIFIPTLTGNHSHHGILSGTAAHGVFFSSVTLAGFAAGIGTT